MYRDDMDGACESSQQAMSPLSRSQYKPPTPRFKLERQKEELEAVLARVNNAIKILDANPGMEEFLEATQGLI